MSDPPDPPPLPRPAAAPTGRGSDRILDIGRALTVRLPDLSWATVTFGVVVVVGIVAWSLLAGAPAPPIETALPSLSPIDPVAPTASTAEPTTAAAVVVHVAGAVEGPGVYELPLGARVADAIDAAGGATPDADLDRVNLAALLIDAEQVYVPVPGEQPPVAAGATEVGGDETTVAGPVDLNTATAAALDALPGVGPVTAAAIVAHREQHGPFTSVTALDDVNGIGPTRLEQLRDLVTVGPTP